MAWTTPGTATAGSVLTASWLNTNVRDNTNALYLSVQRVAYTSRTSAYTVGSTTLASATDVFTGGGGTGAALTFTADGTSSYRVEFYCPVVQTGATAGATVGVYLVDGTGADLGRMGLTGYANGTQAVAAAVHCVYYYAPAAGSRTINIRAIYSAAAGSMTGGAGGSGTSVPMWFAVFGPPMT